MGLTMPLARGKAPVNGIVILVVLDRVAHFAVPELLAAGRVAAGVRLVPDGRRAQLAQLHAGLLWRRPAVPDAGGDALTEVPT